MRKKQQQDISSFDMLLDTMCNTFGGIVFIALLVSILMGSAVREESEANPQESETLIQTESRIELAHLTREEKDLQAAISKLEESLTRTKASSPEAVNGIGVLLASNNVMESYVHSLEETNSMLLRAISESQAEIDSSSNAKANLEAQIARLRNDLQVRQVKATRTARLPRLHKAEGKQSVFLAIKGGRFYAVSDVSGRKSSLRGRGYDTAEVVVESGPGMDVVEVRKTAGQPIKSGSEVSGKLALALSNIDPQTEFPSFCVYPDSFAEFNYVKTLFVARGFEYNWLTAEGAIQIVVTEESLETQ